MLISMNWIGDFVDLRGLDIPALIQRFTLSTAEVEDIYEMGRDLRGVVAGKILTVENHPDSKKLHLLKVDGGDKVYDVVCGAPNVREGLIVPFVKEGGMVGGQEIGMARLAGYESHGMCCSEKELGISADHSGLMELPEDTPVGRDVTELYGIIDTVFEVDNKSLTNRPDLWGHYGIAREFAALSGRELRPLETVSLEQFESLEPIDIDVQDKELCYRYSGLKVRNITKKVSPVDMRIRLFYCGSRAINLLADLTNYLMLETGQPIPVAIAGIMGGLDSEIEEDTDSLLLESANFDGASVRKSSTRLGLRTDASMRYEKTLDPEMTVPAIGRFMKLLLDIDPQAQVISRLTDVYVKHYPKVELAFDKAYVDRYTGIEIEDERIMGTLSSLGFEPRQEGDRFTVGVPSWRATKDVTIKADIIEEITRIYGYDNFDIATTMSPLYPRRRSAGAKADNFVKDILVQTYQLHEVHSYIWQDVKKCRALNIEPEENIRLINAQTPDHEVIRRSMGPTLLSVLGENRAFGAQFGVFEIGRVAEGVRKEDGLVNERKKLGIALFSRTSVEKELYLKLAGIIKSLGRSVKRVELELANCQPEFKWQHPRNTAVIMAEGTALGWICTLVPSVLRSIDRKAAVVCGQLDMDAFASLPEGELSYREPSRFPGIDIDLSVVLPEGMRFADMEPAWKGAGHLAGVGLIDSFEQAGRRSLTLRFSFSSGEKTLSKEEVQPIVDGIIERLSAVGAVLRS